MPRATTVLLIGLVLVAGLVVLSSLVVASSLVVVMQPSQRIDVVTSSWPIRLTVVNVTPYRYKNAVFYLVP